MKAMCQAAWLFTVAGGNFIVLIVAESSAFESRVSCIIANDHIVTLLSKDWYDHVVA